MKSKTMRILALLLAIGMCISLAACKPSTGAQSSSEENVNLDGPMDYVEWTSSVNLGEVVDIVDEQGRAYVTPKYQMRDKSVKFLSHWNAETPDSVHMIAYMEKYGGPNIDFITYTYGECGMKLQAMVLAENAPDVYKLRDRDLVTLMFSNVWSDITNDFDWDNRNWCDLAPFMQYVTVDGKILAAPEMNANTMIWFNRTIFEEYGLEDPLELWEKNQWTKDNFDNICRKLTVKEGGNTSIYGYGFGHTWIREVFAMYDANFVLYDGSKYVDNMDDPKIADAISYINQMGSVEKVYCDMSKASAYFASGKLAMYMYGNWLSMTEPFRSMAVEGKIDFVPIPENTATGLGPRQDYVLGGHAIPVGAKNREEAKAFIEIFNFYKQTPELDMVSTEAQCEINAWTVDQFFRMRAPRKYKNQYTYNELVDWLDLLNKALAGENWYTLRESFRPQHNLVIDSIYGGQ